MEDYTEYDDIPQEEDEFSEDDLADELAACESDEMSHELGKEEMRELYPDLDLEDSDLEALLTPPNERTPRQHERVFEIQHPEYSAQKSFCRNEDGELEETHWGKRGSVRPDDIRQLEDGSMESVDLKMYRSGNVSALCRTIDKQVEKRDEVLGEDTRHTFVLAPAFTVGQAEQLYDHVSKMDNVDVDYLYS